MCCVCVVVSKNTFSNCQLKRRKRKEFEAKEERKKTVFRVCEFFLKRRRKERNGEHVKNTSTLLQRHRIE